MDYYIFITAVLWGFQQATVTDTGLALQIVMKAIKRRFFAWLLLEYSKLK